MTAKDKMTNSNSKPPNKPARFTRYVVEQSPPFLLSCFFHDCNVTIRRITRQTGYTSVSATNVPANQYICVSVWRLIYKMVHADRLSRKQTHHHHYKPQHPGYKANVRRMPVE